MVELRLVVNLRPIKLSVTENDALITNLHFTTSNRK